MKVADPLGGCENHIIAIAGFAATILGIFFKSHSTLKNNISQVDCQFMKEKEEIMKVVDELKEIMRKD